MNYIFKLVHDTFVVWLEPANRYLLLHEPAFMILKEWASQIPEDQIIWSCMKEYGLPMSDACLFVNEVIQQLESLISNNKEEQIICELEPSSLHAEYISFSTKSYLINGQVVQFRYGDPYLEELIHPGFESPGKISESDAKYSFNLFYRGDQLILQSNFGKSYQCSGSKIEYYLGLINMQLLNSIYHTKDNYWMGAVHASSVSFRKGAVLFTAPSGSGKSTFAAILMNRGYEVLADNFSPISLNLPCVYPFPEAILIKNRSLKVLQPYFTSLAATENRYSENVPEVFLPITHNELHVPKAVKAIVFLKYDLTVGFELKKISNLDAMDRFLQQLWLPPTKEVASQFMDWYFQIPCYTLNYSETGKAIDRVSKLFH